MGGNGGKGAVTLAPPEVLRGSGRFIFSFKGEKIIVEGNRNNQDKLEINRVN